MSNPRQVTNLRVHAQQQRVRVCYVALYNAPTKARLARRCCYSNARARSKQTNAAKTVQQANGAGYGGGGSHAK